MLLMSMEFHSILQPLDTFYIRVLATLGTGALAPLFCEAEAITSDEFCKKSINHF
jgi:hypothetical protein